MQYAHVKIWLYAYPQLTKLIEALQTSVENQAVLSFKSVESPLETAEKIARDIFICRDLQALRLALKAVLEKLTVEERALLSYKYFSAEKAVRRNPPCEGRTYYRRQQALLKKLGALLAEKGWTEQAFEEKFSEFTPFTNWYRKLALRHDKLNASLSRNPLPCAREGVSCPAGRKTLREPRRCRTRISR